MAVAEMRDAFDRRRSVMTSMLNAIDGVRCAEPEGAFYCFPNVTGLLGRPLAGRVVELVEPSWRTLLLETIQIAVVPGEAFGDAGLLSPELRARRRGPRRRDSSRLAALRRGGLSLGIGPVVCQPHD